MFASSLNEVCATSRSRCVGVCVGRYARTNMRPQLHGIDEGKVAQLYADLRRESATSGGVPIAVRHIESVGELGGFVLLCGERWKVVNGVGEDREKREAEAFSLSVGCTPPAH